MTEIIGRFVLCRTHSAGVHYGYLAQFVGKFVKLTEARRLWSWNGANTLHEVVLRGVSDDSRISEPVDEICLTEVVEVLFPTPEAMANLRRSRWGS